MRFVTKQIGCNKWLYKINFREAKWTYFSEILIDQKTVRKIQILRIALLVVRKSRWVLLNEQNLTLWIIPILGKPNTSSVTTFSLRTIRKKLLKNSFCFQNNIDNTKLIKRRCTQWAILESQGYSFQENKKTVNKNETQNNVPTDPPLLDCFQKAWSHNNFGKYLGTPPPYL